MQQKPWLNKQRQYNATALHEANFAKLARVVPCLGELEIRDRVFAQADSRLELQVLEVSKYTKTFSLCLKQAPHQIWLPHLQMKIRNYYDAGVTEVLAFQDHYRLDSRYQYPNRQMHQCNEKWQINHFLKEWLDHCLLTACIFSHELESTQ